MDNVPAFRSNSPMIDEAFELALADLWRSTSTPIDLDEFKQPVDVFLAGEFYTTPWARDAAINTWNAAGLLYPDIAANTMKHVLETRDDKPFIGGEYWDSIIWALGAWHLYLCCGDRDFLNLAYKAVRNTIQEREQSERSTQTGLFYGPAVYADGVGAYPDRYAAVSDGGSSIKRWVETNTEYCVETGFGLPMQSLSTNCVYVRAYEILHEMETALGVPSQDEWRKKAAILRSDITTHFWSESLGRYKYLVDPFGGSDCQEGFGHAFALLFGIANEQQARSAIDHFIYTSSGTPCLWPPFERYQIDDHFGRHSGTIWPPIQALWAEATLAYGNSDLFGEELERIARNAVRDGQFHEVFHPDTGLPYGGLQERHNLGITLWESMPHQTWSATAYLRMILTNVVGLHLQTDGMRVAPVAIKAIDEFELRSLRYRGHDIDVTLRSGQAAPTIRVDGNAFDGELIPAE